MAHSKNESKSLSKDKWIKVSLDKSFTKISSDGAICRLLKEREENQGQEKEFSSSLKKTLNF